jgi:hypothetical protein
MNSDIATFRRIVLVTISILFFGLAFNSVASANLRVVESKYRVELNGLYVHDWHDEEAEYPDPDEVWTTERGTITSGFSTGKGIVFKGTKFVGEAPRGIDLPEFQFYPVGRLVAKAHNTQKVVEKQNFVPSCGGELGECTGAEKSGVETISKKCRKPNAKLPFELDFERRSRADLSFGFHPSNHDFCGEKFPFFDSVDRLPERMGIANALDIISRMKRGQTRSWRGSKEIGEISEWKFGLQPPRTVKKCPAMTGEGTQRCWITEMRIDIKRIR